MQIMRVFFGTMACAQRKDTGITTLAIIIATNLQAAIGVAQLEQLQGFVERKISIMSEYINLLSTCEHIELLPLHNLIQYIVIGCLLFCLKMVLIETSY